MSKFAVMLIIVSSILHVNWNVLMKKNGNALFFLRSFLLWIIIIGFFPFIYFELKNPVFPVIVWVCLLVSGLFCSLYCFGLANAYESKDFSVTYPIIRALPVVLIAAAEAIRGKNPSLLGLAGMLMVLLGCFIIPYKTFREIRWDNYKNFISMWFLMAVLGTTGYSISDKIASELVIQGPASAFRYAYLFFLFTFLYYLLVLKFFGFRNERKEKIVNLKNSLIAAISNLCAYWLILWAFQLSFNAGYVIALRQFGIVWGVLLGLMLFREKGAFVRIAGSFIICGGISLISLYG